MENAIKANEKKENKNQKRLNPISLLIFIAYLFIPIILMLIFFIPMKKYSNEIANIFIKFDYFKNLVKNLSTQKEITILIIKELSFFLVNIFTIISLIIMLFLTKKRNDSISNKKSNISLKNKIIIGCFFGVLMILSTYIISSLYTFIGFDSASKNTQNIMNYLKSEKLMLIMILIVAPIGEEIAFKYGLFTFFHEIFKSKGRFLEIIFPSFISAFMFSIIHDGVLLIPIYFFPSFIGCLIYEKTKTLMPCILGHFINNFFVVIILMFT